MRNPIVHGNKNAREKLVRRYTRRNNPGDKKVVVRVIRRISRYVLNHLPARAKENRKEVVIIPLDELLSTSTSTSSLNKALTDEKRENG